MNSLAGTGGWVVSRKRLPNFIFQTLHKRYTRDSIQDLQRWPRAVGKLAGDATLGPGQFLFVDPRPSLTILPTGNRVPLTFWKPVSIHCRSSPYAGSQSYSRSLQAIANKTDIQPTCRNCPPTRPSKTWPKECFNPDEFIAHGCAMNRASKKTISRFSRLAF